MFYCSLPSVDRNIFFNFFSRVRCCCLHLHPFPSPSGPTPKPDTSTTTPATQTPHTNTNAATAADTARLSPSISTIEPPVITTHLATTTTTANDNGSSANSTTSDEKTNTHSNDATQMPTGAKLTFANIQRLSSLKAARSFSLGSFGSYDDEW